MNPFLMGSDFEGPTDIRKPKVQFDYMKPYQTSRASEIMLNSNDDSDERDAYERHKQLMLTPSPSEDVINSLEADRPKREDYKPNTITKILAALTGFTTGMKDPSAGASAAEKLLDQPYNKALDEYKQDNEGRLANAKVEDSAFNRKLLSSQFDLTESRQRKQDDNAKAQHDVENQRHQNEDIAKIDEQLRKQGNEDRDYELSKTKTNAQADSDKARAEYYRTKGIIDPDAPEKPVDVLRDQKIDAVQEKKDKRAAVEHLFRNVPGFDSMLEYDAAKDSYGPSDETAGDPKKLKGLLAAIDQTSKALKARNGSDTHKRRYRRLP